MYCVMNYTISQERFPYPGSSGRTLRGQQLYFFNTENCLNTAGTDPANPNVFAVFIIIFLSCLLRDNIFHLLRKPPAVRCKAKPSYCPRRHASRSESIPQCKRRFPHKLNTPKYLPVPYLRHPPHQPPVGDRPRKWLIRERNPAPNVF